MCHYQVAHITFSWHFEVDLKFLTLDEKVSKRDNCEMPGELFHLQMIAL
jgi:hypothetical protein